MSVRSQASTYSLLRARGDQGARGHLLIDNGASALERAVHRGHRRLEQLGDLGRAPAEHVAEDEDDPLAPRQALDRRQERELDALPLCVARRRVEHGRGGICEAGVRVRVDRGLRTARAAFDLVETCVGRDPVQPRLDGRAALEAGERAPGLQQRLLRDVLGVVQGAEHAIAVHLECPPIGLDELCECALVPGLRRREQLVLVTDLSRGHGHAG